MSISIEELREKVEARIKFIDEFIKKVETDGSICVVGDRLQWLDASEEVFKEHGFDKDMISDPFYFGDALRLAVDELHYLLWDIREEEDKGWKNSDEYKELVKQRQESELF